MMGLSVNLLTHFLGRNGPTKWLTSSSAPASYFQRGGLPLLPFQPTPLPFRPAPLARTAHLSAPAAPLSTLATRPADILSNQNCLSLTTLAVFAPPAAC